MSGLGLGIGLGGLRVLQLPTPPHSSTSPINSIASSTTPSAAAATQNPSPSVDNKASTEADANAATPTTIAVPRMATPSPQDKTTHLETQTSHQHLVELAEEVIRLRTLLMASGKATDVAETLKLERLSQLEEENLRLQRQVQLLTAKLHDLERAQTEAEFTAEVGEERFFNRQRAESPHAVSLPIANSPHTARRMAIPHTSGPPPQMVPALSTSPSWAIPRPPMHHYFFEGQRTRSSSDASISSNTSGTSAH